MAGVWSILPVGCQPQARCECIEAAVLVDGSIEGVSALGLQLSRGGHAAGDAVQPHERLHLPLHICDVLPVPPACQASV